MGITYDTGVLIAADRAMWALHAGFLAEEVTPTVPAPGLAEARRVGSRHAHLARFLTLCVVEDMDGDQAKVVGVLAGKSDHDDVVDVTVVEGAIRRRDAIVTSNPTQLRHITVPDRAARLGNECGHIDQAAAARAEDVLFLALGLSRCT